MVKLFDTKVKIEMRLFIILGWTALIANTVGFFSNLLFYGLTPDTIFYGICAVIIFMLGIFEKQTGKDLTAATMILALINLIEFPVMYYLYGTGRIVYMILGVLGILVFTRKERRIALAVLMMIMDAVIMVVSAICPSTYIHVTPESDLGASIASFVIVMISMILIFILIIKQYETQNQELKELSENLKDMAIRDPLTLLYNRRYLTEYLDTRMAKNDTSFAIVLMDLDDFKEVNDNYGHLYGDEVLQNIAEILKKEVQDRGIAARFGGEEFMLVLDTTKEKEIEILMQNIRRKYEAFSMKTKGVQLTFSGGVEIFQKEKRITALFNAADQKLYQAKAQGKNKVVYS